MLSHFVLAGRQGNRILQFFIMKHQIDPNLITAFGEAVSVTQTNIIGSGYLLEADRACPLLNR